MSQRAAAPGTCSSCGNDAYIRLAGGDGGQAMVCASCFADRVRDTTRPEDAEARESDIRR